MNCPKKKIAMSRKVGIVHGVNDVIEEICEVTNDVADGIEENFKGWKNFAFKKDVLKVSIGMIMAMTFQSVVNSMVVDIITPMIIGYGVGTHVENLFLVLKQGNTYNVTYVTVEDAKEDNAVTLNYGLFINMVSNLVFASLFLYTLIRTYACCKKRTK